MICIYHSRDLDGWCSAAIVQKKFPGTHLIGWDYGKPIPFDKLIPGEPVIMVDISFDMDSMVKVAKNSGFNLTWIDHHISAINDYNSFMVNYTTLGGEPFMTAVLENGIAACEGTWKHFFPNKPIPMAVELLGMYDTWRRDDIRMWEAEILPFQMGMKLGCDSPETFPTTFFSEGLGYDTDYVWDIIEEGRVILNYQTQINKTQCGSNAFGLTFKGLRAICLNGGGFNSDVFKSVYDEDKHDIMMPFQFNGNYWVVSLYTTKEDIDCSKLAKEMGGGGHRKAAGFQIDNIYKLLNQEDFYE